MMFTEKYKPTRLSDLIGNADAIESARRWALSWERKKEGRPLLVYGPPGVGKTALAHALAFEFNWELLEMNASDLRDSESIERIAGAAARSGTLSGKIKLILIDDVDSLQAADRGGISAIARILRDAKQPVLLTAADLWERKLSGIRGECVKLEMKKINSSAILNYLKKIARKENIKIGEEEISAIATNADGDLRSALNDLQALNRNALRDREKEIFESLRGVFKSQTYLDARRASFEVDLEHDMFKYWLEENIMNEYENKKEIADSYDFLSRADVFDGRIIRRQYWGFLRYSNDLMCAGIALAKKEPYSKYTNYSYPSYIRMLGHTKHARKMEKEIGLKIAAKTHCSSKDAKEYFSLLRNGCRRDILAVKEYYSFEDEELAFLLRVSEEEIEKILREAKEKNENESKNADAKISGENGGKKRAEEENSSYNLADFL